jgi:DNA-binding transcriptional regulator YhcF (GntR family)
LTSLPLKLRPLDESSSQPLYQQLQRSLRDAIERRLLSPDDALPPERDLATDLSVSRITVRKAIDGLVSEGLLVRRQGSGTFVCARVEKNFSKLTSFSEDMRARGRTPRSVWLRRSEGTVTPEEALSLRLSPGTPVYRFHRIRFADDAPPAYLRSNPLNHRCMKPSKRAAIARCGPSSACVPCSSMPSRRSYSAPRNTTRGSSSSAWVFSRTAALSNSRSPTTGATSTISSPSSARRRECRAPHVAHVCGSSRCFRSRALAAQ